MASAQSHARFPRILRLAEKLRNSRYRKTYVGAHVRQFLARQMREMRGEESQKAFGEKIDKPQNVVSRLEDPNYGKWTLSNLLEIANKLDRALIVRFVDYQTFLKWTDDQSPIAAAPAAYDQELVDQYAWDIAQQQTLQKFTGIYMPQPSATVPVTAPAPSSDIDILLLVASSETQIQKALN